MKYKLWQRIFMLISLVKRCKIFVFSEFDTLKLLCYDEIVYLCLFHCKGGFFSHKSKLTNFFFHLFLGTFLCQGSTWICVGAAAVDLVSRLLSLDQRSAAQLSHSVRHRISSILQQWCQVQGLLATLDLQSGLRVSSEKSDRAGLRNGSRHRGHGAKGPWSESQGWKKYRQGDGGYPKRRATLCVFCLSHMTFTHLLALLIR